MEKTAQPRPFGLRDKIGYLFGDFGNDFTFILSTVILSKFYTDVMGVSAGVVGTVMMLARAVDAVTDLSMGRLCDRSRPTPVGKFKPWLLRLCVPVAAASFLLYQSGFAGMRYSISNTAEYGDYITGPKLITEETKKTMKKILKDIQDGTFAKDFLLDMSSAGGQVHFNAMRKLASEHPSEAVGADIRKLYSWSDEDKLINN